jgi:hypothetical protein
MTWKMKNNNIIARKMQVKDELTNFLLYTSPGGQVKVEAILANETVWLTQEKMSQVFGFQVPAISKHLKNIFESGELNENSVISILETTATDGKNYQVKFFNLDAIISVGYRVNSSLATQFRIWATNTLKEFIIKGFVIDDYRLKNGQYFGKDYFEELLERVRSIRASERRIYQKITDIFAECSIDYNKNSQVAQDFYAEVQNKFHFAITGYTAAKIIYTQAGRQRVHGTENLEKCAQRACFEKRCYHRQKLSATKRNTKVGTNNYFIFRLY